MSHVQSAVQVNKLITLFNDSPKFTFLLQVNYLIDKRTRANARKGRNTISMLNHFLVVLVLCEEGLFSL